MAIATNLDVMATLPPGRTGLGLDQLADELDLLGPRWTVASTEFVLHLAGPMTKTGMVAAFAGVLADELDHHPRIVLEYAGLRLHINTHEAKAITVMDLIYAARLEQWLRANGWPLAKS
ncbi:MAG: 4a-hydroxytetrahydrobiopterin dehydratase [Proteobacteria bacterium]|nr:4a-hydroxytetrahydrobiopterin dehydratase [Pseudomonadota bacterium]